MDRREMIKGSVASIAVIGASVSQTACPFDGVSKEKAVKYTGIAVDYLKDVLPIVSQLGNSEIANLINRAIPILEKVKKALDDSEFPEAGDFFKQVTGILGQIATALLQLPESPRVNQIMAILTLVNITLRTVSLFVETDTPPSMVDKVPGAVRTAAAPDPIRRAFQASKF